MLDSIKNPYIAEDRVPRMRKSIVAFIDILGFKALISGSEAEDALVKVKEAIGVSSKRLKKVYPTINDCDAWVVKMFSDNVAIGFPVIIRDEGIAEMGIICSRLEEFQYRMISHGFFVRGAVEIGELYMDDEIVFGKALLDAYEAEKSSAVNPRIILGPTAKKEVKRFIDKFGYTHSPGYLTDTDSHLFLNYLDSVVLEFKEECGRDLKKLFIHKEQVESKLHEFSNKPSVLSKYAWTANYHNYFCDLNRFDPKYKVDSASLQDFLTEPPRFGV